MSETERLRAEVKALRDEIASLRVQMAQMLVVHHHYHHAPDPQPQPAQPWTPWVSPNAYQGRGLQIEAGPGVFVEMVNGAMLP